ncbi:MAG TPA: molybdate ABC transporter substrate-binding protein [Candidatus Didemnitutus sp.]|nr:molybdate ABC transporter substrate-binding protein [Candidatus Didemnitutus sp.]
MNIRLFSLASFFAALALSLHAADLNVFAAASLSDALKQLAPAYEAKSGGKLLFNFGASSTLARQIKEGAPADVFFSADEAKMDDVAKAGLLAANTRVTLLSNTLVIVVNATRSAPVASPADLGTPAVQLLALAETQTVPAGIYARAYLEKAGLWDKVTGKIVPTENVRATLTVVELGNADAGIVYKTDALISKKVRIAYEVPLTDGPKIAYPVAVTTDSRNADAARKFVAFLASPEARAVFEKYGFLPTGK